MADLMPDYDIERMRLRVQIGQLQQNRLATELRMMQLRADLQKAQQQIEATDAAIAEQEAVSASLPTE